MKNAAVRTSVAIIGTGNVGVAAAYVLFSHRIANEIILVDKDRRRAEGEAMDLMYGQPFVGRVSVRAGDYPDLDGCQIVVISAGAGQKPGEDRLQLLNRNAAIMGDIVSQLDRYAPEAILLVATNPVDIVTRTIQQLSRRPHRRILGTGTTLDTARFRTVLAEHYGVDPRSVHAYILGEHGDSEVPVWSNALIGGQPLLNNEVLGKRLTHETQKALFEQARGAAYALIERKGNTSVAIGLVIARLVETILQDQKTVLAVSTQLQGEYGLRDVCLSVPCCVGHDGVEALVLPPLSAEELAGLQRSAHVLQECWSQMELGR